MSLAFVLSSFAVTLLPGPDLLYMLFLSMTQGFRHALAFSFGLTTGCILHTLIAALGLGLLLSEFPHMLTLIKYVGIGYLAYLGLNALRHASQTRSGTNSPNRSLFSAYRRGVWMNLINPKVVLFFLAFFPQFVVPAHNAVAQMLFLGLIFSLITICCFALLAAASHHTFKLNQALSAQRQAQMSALIFLGLAAWLWWSG